MLPSADFKSFYKSIDDRKFNTWCKYTKRIDTYGCGCQHDCSYCYAKSLLNFRGLWNAEKPNIANIAEIWNKIKNIPINEVIKLGGMTDCFQPIERENKITYQTIKMLNRRKINYLIVTKSDLCVNPEYLKIYDKTLSHFQITATTTNDEMSLKYEKTTTPSNRIKAIETLQKYGFDVSVRLSPFICEHIDLRILNEIKCDKILIEFLKVNHWVKKWFNIDYSKYTLKYGGYSHLQLEDKINYVNKINGFEQKTVGEYVADHHKYFSEKVNYNKSDCCNLSLNLTKPKEYKQQMFNFKTNPTNV